MATANITSKKPCSKCDKGSGIFTCDGCQLSFCRKHSDEHRQELAIQMDSLGQEYDLFHRDISREMDKHPLFSRIDTWERESINKIQQVAQQARTDFSQAIDQKKQQIKTILSGQTNELQKSRESDDFTEIDLKNWIAQLNELQRDFEQLINARLADEEDPRSTIHLIKVRNLSQLGTLTPLTRTFGQNISSYQSAMPVNKERFGVADKEIEISENSLVATHRKIDLNRPAVIFGVNQYSVDKHQIRFRIERRTDDGFYIGIVTLAQMDPSSVFTSTSTTSGWWPSHGTAENGILHYDRSTDCIAQGDEITMILNCDENKIYFNYERTKRSLQLPIDIQKCPFPWKVIVGLSDIGNSIRILY